MAIGLHIDSANQGIIEIDNLIVSGGDIGVKLAGGSYISHATVSFDSRETGILVEFPPGGENGSCRIDEGAAISFRYFSPPVTPWCGVKVVNGGGHVFKSVTIIGQSGLDPVLTTSFGYRVGGPNGVAATEIFDSLIQSCETGVLLGDVGEQVNDITVRDCSIFACSKDGIRIGDKNSAICVVSGNNIQMQEMAPTIPTGLTVNGNFHRVSDNGIDLSGISPATPAVCAQFGTGVKTALKLAVSNNVMQGNSTSAVMVVTGCNESSFTGNNLEKLSIDATPVLDATADASGNTYTGNIVRNPGDPGSVTAAISIAGDLNALTGNRTRTAVNVSGIDLTGVTNTAVGNVCENAPPALPVSFVPGNTVGLNAA
jgi:hypothetical protein